MRLRAIAFAVAAFGLAGAAAWAAGRAAADYAEGRAETALAAAFAEAGLDWTLVRANGLVVFVGGAAPDETGRFHALEIARHVVDLGRLEDRIAVAAVDAARPPDFALELLRSERDVSLVGLVPEAEGPAIGARLAAAGIDAAVIDMLETADHPAPDLWEEALGLGLAALGALPRAKVSVEPGAVTVVAVAADEAERAALARRIEAAAPPGVALHLDLSAPRPVIAPFAVAFRIGPDGTARLAACAAETEEDAEAILAAARAAGLGGDAEGGAEGDAEAILATARAAGLDEEAEGDAQGGAEGGAGAGDCALGLGAPSPDWAAATVRGIEAVAMLGGGSFALTDLEAVLVGPPGLAPDALAAAGAALGRGLPQVFTLATRGGAPAGLPAGEAAAYAPEFEAVLGGDGRVRLGGPLGDRTSQIAVLGFAEAVFGHGWVSDGTILDPALAEGWPGQVLAGLEALSLLEEGRMEVTPEGLAVTGRSPVEAAERELEAFFAEKGMAPVLLDVAFDAEKAAVVAEAARPPAEICAEAVAGLLAADTIGFETGSARIDEASEGVVAAIAATLGQCPGARFEVSGHTDARGSAAANQALSERRAEAVAEAVAAFAPVQVALEPRGYGPDRPVADNDTGEGRALNRRIEFALLAEPAAGDGAAGAELAAAGAEGAEPAAAGAEEAAPAAAGAEEAAPAAAGEEEAAPAAAGAEGAAPAAAGAEEGEGGDGPG